MPKKEESRPVVNVLREAEQNLLRHESSGELGRKIRKVVSTKRTQITAMIQRAKKDPEAIKHHTAASILRFSQSPTAEHRYSFPS